MPARDKIHEAVIRALEKQGWRVLHDPFVISIDKKSLFIDLMIRHVETQRIMLVEIKTFDDRSQITALASAIGKYMIYQHAMVSEGNSEIPLVLAIPESVFDGIFSTQWVKSLVGKIGIELVIVAMETEEVVQWT